MMVVVESSVGFQSRVGFQSPFVERFNCIILVAFLEHIKCKYMNVSYW